MSSSSAPGLAASFRYSNSACSGLKAHIIDALPKPGGQCTELYPDKPIYDIPAIPVCDAQDLVDRLMKQIEPFGATFHLDQQVSEVRKHEDDTFTVRRAPAPR